MKQPDLSMPKILPCKHLRSHEMMFGGDALSGDLYCSGAYWCLITQKALGPDAKEVNAVECQDGRRCFNQD